MPDPASRARSCRAASCWTEHEVDHYWDRLTDGGEESQCGWREDRFGLSWQIVPDRLDPARAAAATSAMYGMHKIVISDLEKAAESASAGRPTNWALHESACCYCLLANSRSRSVPLGP
jgi:hypothetical protein